MLFPPLVAHVIVNNGIIHNQWGFPQRNLRIGATGNGGEHGCGPFAIYNALFHLSNANNRTDPARIIRGLDIIGAFNFGGSAGTNPHAMVDNLRLNTDRSITIQYFPDNISSFIRNSSVSILLYEGDIKELYFHYVMIRHDGTQYHIYNLEAGSTHAFRTNSINNWLTTQRNFAISIITIN